MEGRKLETKLEEIWHEDKEGYHLCYKEAQRRIPIKYNSKKVPTNIKKVREEILKVYGEYKRGKLIVDTIHPSNAGKLISKFLK